MLRGQYPPPKKVAIVHDWLPVFGGAERVLEQIIAVFPQADIFSMVDLLPPESRGFLGGRPVTTSFMRNLPLWMQRRYRAFLPLMPVAVEQFDLAEYDLVISSSYAVAKGVLTGPNQLHICYCHSPMRYAWDLQHQYLRESRIESSVKGLMARIFLHQLRLWDVTSQLRVDHFLTNSHFVRRRVMKIYRREAKVIYPPVDTEHYKCCPPKGNYYLTASRMVPYKMVGLIVAAFAKMPDRELRVIGDGPEYETIRRMAPSNVTMLGFMSNEDLKREMGGAKAFLFAAEEDFGIVMVEAQACGTPVIAYGRGGALETVIPGVTGLFFREQTTAAVCASVEEFEATQENFQPGLIRKNAERFSQAAFREQFDRQVMHWWDEFVEDSTRSYS